MSLPPFLTAALADRYLLERVLGAGGMATVYLATDVKHRRKVAVKVLRPELAAALGAERFQREIEIAAQLQHPHILPLLDSGAVAGPEGSGRDGFLFYVMPYVQGESLRDRLAREGRLPLGDAIRILREVADALAHAHRRGIVHRDIKPENILLAERHALVADFGVAKAIAEGRVEEGAGLTSVGLALGTPAYMAPEQAAADPSVDSRADLYAFGVVAYEVLTGRMPFTAATPAQMLAAHIAHPPEPITGVRPDLPPVLAALVMRCLAKERDQRGNGADQLVAELETLGPASGANTPVPFSLPVAPPPRPLRTLGLLLLGAIVVLGAIYALVLFVGLPDWVFQGGAALLVAGLLVGGGTVAMERRRHATRVTGTYHPSHETAVQRLLTWAGFRRGGLLAFSGLTVATVAYMAMRLLGIGPVGTLLAAGSLSARDRIVVADFVNRTSDSTLGASIAEAFRIDLGQSRLVGVFDQAAVKDGLQRMGRAPGTTLDPAVARELAQREGAKAYVAGDVASVGSGYVLTARLLAAADGAELVALRETAGGGGDLIAAIDRLSKKLRGKIGDPLKSLRAAEPLEQVTTASLDALRLYTEAQHDMDRGQDQFALTKLQEAVAIDSGFAMAWRKLAVVRFNNSAARSAIQEAATRAFQHRDRLPELERHLTDAYYYYSVTDDNGRAETAYRAVLERKPDDITSLNNLSLVLMRGRRWAAAETLLTRALMADSLRSSPYVNLVEVMARQGRPAEAAAINERMDRVLPRAHDIAAGYRMNLAAMAGAWDSAEGYARELERLATRGGSLPWSINAQAAFAIIRGRVGEGRTQIGRGERAEQEENPAAAVQYAVYRGDLEAEYGAGSRVAVRNLEQALLAHPLEKIAVADRPYLSLANFFSYRGAPDQARRLLEEYAANDSAARLPTRGNMVARAWLLVAEKKFPEALSLLRMAQDSSSCPQCSSYFLAEAFDLAGQPDSAVIYWERAVAVPAEWERFWDDVTSLPRAYQRLGEVYEAKGNRAKALDYYGRFVELWRDADPSLQPRVTDIKQRIARLVAEQG
ncbi:MAG: protein kinase [Gemmatimonadales bacterium]